MECLDRIRTGTDSDADIEKLNSTSVGVTHGRWREHTQLRANNKDVVALNMSELNALPGTLVEYPCRDALNAAITHPKRREYATGRLPDLEPPSVSLKPGAVVLLTRAVDGVPTATQGTVLRCTSANVVVDFLGRSVTVPYVTFQLFDNCNDCLASRSAIPLTLA